MSPGLSRFRNRSGYERWSKVTDTPLLALALLFVVVLVVPLLADLSPAQQFAATAVNAAIWAVFTIDYFARLYLALDRWRYVRTHVLDLVIVILPMLRPLRALRVIRVLRLGSVAALAHKRATRSLHVRVTTFVLSAVVVSLLASGIAIREAERGSPEANIKTFGDGLWWAATTVTTVGYGDRFPTTPLGRLIAVALMLVGIALLGVVTASFAAWFVDRLRTVEEKVEAVEEKTEVTLDAVLAELREVRIRLDESLDLAKRAD